MLLPPSGALGNSSPQSGLVCNRCRSGSRGAQHPSGSSLDPGSSPPNSLCTLLTGTCADKSARSWAKTVPAPSSDDARISFQRLSEKLGVFKRKNIANTLPSLHARRSNRRLRSDGGFHLLESPGNKQIRWVWLKINQEGQTACFGPCFHLPGQPMLQFRFF